MCAPGSYDWCQELTLLATRHRLYILRTIRVEPARSIDFLWCHPARDIAHLLADVVAPDAGRKSLELGAQIDRWLSSKPSRAGFAFDTVTGSAGCDPAHRRAIRDDAGPHFGIEGMV